MSDRIYRSAGRRYVVWVTLGTDDAIVAVVATDGHPLDAAPFAVLDRDEAAALHADLGAWLDELTAERCACGLVSRGLVDGVCADCRDRRTAEEGTR